MRSLPRGVRSFLQRVDGEHAGRIGLGGRSLDDGRRFLLDVFECPGRRGDDRRVVFGCDNLFEESTGFFAGVVLQGVDRGGSALLGRAPVNRCFRSSDSPTADSRCSQRGR